MKIVRLEKPQEVLGVLIADRDFMSSDVLATIVRNDPKFLATTTHPTELLRTLALSQPDVVVIGSDMNSKSWNAIELTSRIHRDYPMVSTVVLLDYPTHDSVIDVYRAGAKGVFSRHQNRAEFLDCIWTVGKGNIWAGKHETDILLAALKALSPPRMIADGDLPDLTARELEVVKCAAKGKTNKVIANELGLSEHTIKNYLWRAFEKLGVSSRVELLFYLASRGHSFSVLNVANNVSSIEM